MADCQSVGRGGWVGWVQETQTQPIKVHVRGKSHIYTVVRPLLRDVFFSFLFFSLRSSRYQLGKTVAAEQTQWPVEHVKNKHESEFGAIQ